LGVRFNCHAIVTLADEWNQMRFRLRTLMIVLAAGGVLFARVGYLKRMAAFHRREASARIARIANNCDLSVAEVAKTVRENVDEKAREWSDVRHSSRDGLGTDLNASAYFHEAMADRYERACYRPWQPVRP